MPEGRVATAAVKRERSRVARGQRQACPALAARTLYIVYKSVPAATDVAPSRVPRLHYNLTCHYKERPNGESLASDGGVQLDS